MTKHQTFSVIGMSCASCSRAVENAVSKLSFVTVAGVNLATEKLSVTYDDRLGSDADIKKAVEAAGFALEDNKPPAAKADTGEWNRGRNEFFALLVFALVLTYVAMAHMVPWIPYPDELRPSNAFALNGLIQFALSIPIIYFGRNFYIKGFKSLFRGAPNMDTLVAVATGTAFIYSVGILIWGAFRGESEMLYFDSPAMVITLISLGRLLEAKQKLRTGNAIARLYALAAPYALVKSGDDYIKRPTDLVEKGDICLVKPGATVPVDGIIIEGETEIDESMLTGESMPVKKSAGDTVTGATININGAVVIRATDVGEDSTLSGIIRIVEHASGSKAPIQKLADTVAGWFVPAALGIALIAFIVWIIVSRDFAFSLKIFVSVLVISCPCALGLATPTAITVGAGAGAKRGILFKDGEALQIAHKTSVLVLDKTGTITSGALQVTDVFSPDGQDDSLLRLTASAEALSEHPVGGAIAGFAKERGLSLYDAGGFTAAIGKGVTASVNGKTVAAGNLRHMESIGVDCDKLKTTASTYAGEGKTAVFVSVDGVPAGVIAVSDSIKPDSASAVSQLHALGIKTVMITGDNAVTAAAVARAVGVDGVLSEVAPDKKADEVKRLMDSGETVSMAGDGINDAPALSTAHCGIAVGGTDIAADAADIVIVGGSLGAIPAAIRLSANVMRNIKQNLFWAFCYNAIAIPVACGVLYAFGGPLLSPAIAAAAMSLSSICVVSNALRLNFVKF